MNVPTILIPRKWTSLDTLRPWGGRKKATTGGSLVSDLAALQKTLVLCGSCQHKFDYRRRHYYSVWRYEHTSVIGACDVCKIQIVGNDGRLFIHEANREAVWATPDDQRRAMATAHRIATTNHQRRN